MIWSSSIYLNPSTWPVQFRKHDLVKQINLHTHIMTMMPPDVSSTCLQNLITMVYCSPKSQVITVQRRSKTVYYTQKCSDEQWMRALSYVLCETITIDANIHRIVIETKCIQNYPIAVRLSLMKITRFLSTMSYWKWNIKTILAKQVCKNDKTWFLNCSICDDVM